MPLPLVMYDSVPLFLFEFLLPLLQTETEFRLKHDTVQHHDRALQPDVECTERLRRRVKQLPISSPEVKNWYRYTGDYSADLGPANKKSQPKYLKYKIYL
jgi:hypothetical protein